MHATEHQSSPVDLARSRADTGILRVTLATERTSPGWVEQALGLIDDLIKLYGDVALSAEPWRNTPFTVEALRGFLAPRLPEPSDQRIWGAVTRAAVRQGLIVRTGDFAPACSSNGSPKPLYRLGKSRGTDGGLARG